MNIQRFGFPRKGLPEVDCSRPLFYPPLKYGSNMFQELLLPQTLLNQFSNLMAQNVPWLVNSNYTLMVECSRTIQDGRQWPGKIFCSETEGWAKYDFDHTFFMLRHQCGIPLYFGADFFDFCLMLFSNLPADFIEFAASKRKTF